MVAQSRAGIKPAPTDYCRGNPLWLPLTIKGIIMLEKLLAVLREHQYDKKPNVDILKDIDGLEDVNAKQRDEAWNVYQQQQSDDTASKSTLATHTVTVKKNGFRRLGKAWSGSSNVRLTDNEVAILDACPMFIVVAL